MTKPVQTLVRLVLAGDLVALARVSWWIGGENLSLASMMLVSIGVITVTTAVAILAFMLLAPRRPDDVREPRRRGIADLLTRV